LEFNVPFQHKHGYIRDEQGHVDSKTLLQQNPPVLNWGCQLTQYNGSKLVLVIMKTVAATAMMLMKRWLPVSCTMFDDSGIKFDCLVCGSNCNQLQWPFATCDAWKWMQFCRCQL